MTTKTELMPDEITMHVTFPVNDDDDYDVLADALIAGLVDNCDIMPELISVDYSSMWVKQEPQGISADLVPPAVAGDRREALESIEGQIKNVLIPLIQKLDAPKTAAEYGFAMKSIALINVQFVKLRAALSAPVQDGFLKPKLPPYPGEIPDGPMPRYGLKWNGPDQPIAVPMDDGYWTPWHIANHKLCAPVDTQGVDLDKLSKELYDNSGLIKTRQVLDPEEGTLLHAAVIRETVLYLASRGYLKGGE